MYKQPSRGFIGSIIREILSRGGYGGDLLSLLFAADRVHQFYYAGVLGLLEKRGIAVFDRYKYSSIVYQSLAEPSPPQKWIQQVNQAVPPPHILVFLDVPPKTAYRRIVERSKRTGRARQVYETIEFLEKVYNKYSVFFDEMQKEPEHCISTSSREKPVWWRLLSKRGVDPSRIWLEGECYPRILRVPGVIGGEEEPVERVARRIAGRVLELLEQHYSLLNQLKY